MIRIIMAIFLLSSIQSHAAEKWKISDFQGYFHFSVDIPGPYFKGELNMNYNDLSCTYQSANFYKAGSVQSWFVLRHGQRCPSEPCGSLCMVEYFCHAGGV